MLIFFATLLQGAAAVLTLDARPDADRCRSVADTGDVTVCGQEGRRSTRMPVRIGGAPATLLVEPGGPDDFECNPAFIVRAGIQGQGPIAISDIGPIEVQGAIGSVGASIDDRRIRGYARWAAREAVVGADCVVGPRGLPHAVVRFLLGAARADATTVELPFHYPGYGALYAEWRVGKRALAVRFEIERGRTVLTAPSARAIAPAFGLTATGPVVSEMIAWGVDRPVRRLATNVPVKIGNMSIDAPFVRVADFGNAMNVRSISPDEIDAGDVVVNAKRDYPGRIRIVRVGRPDLARCVSITVDKRRRVVRLEC